MVTLGVLLSFAAGPLYLITSTFIFKGTYVNHMYEKAPFRGVL
jgi:hypothetical protein